jgi:hypothetical protein
MPGKLPPIGESVKSGNRMSALEAEEMKAMKARKPRGGMPPIGESVKSGNRISAQEAAEMKAMKMKKGGAVDKDGIKMRKYAMGGPVRGLEQAAAMSGRAMPARGLEQAAAMSGRGPRMMKDGGPVKSGACKRGSDNMAMMAKALKGKK